MLQTFLFLIFSGLAWMGYFQFIRWFRQRSPEARERTAFKRRLPTWVKFTELLLWVAFFMGIFLPLFRGVLALNAFVNHNGNNPNSLSTGLIVFSCLFAALAPAMLAGNLISWLVPAMRNANEEAMRGLPAASFTQANLGLLKFAAIITPICIAAASVGVLGPWQ